MALSYDVNVRLGVRFLYDLIISFANSKRVFLQASDGMRALVRVRELGDV